MPQQRLDTAVARFFHPCGLEQAFPDLDQLTPYPKELPGWWENNNNIFYIDKNMPFFAVDLRMLPGIPPPRNCTIVCRSPVKASMTLWGDGSFIHVGRRNRIPQSRLSCGNAAIFLGNDISATWALTVNARNGGLVHFQDDCMIASSVQCNTDDMHSLRDLATGRRINIFGGHILVGRHVWVGQESLLLGNTAIGDNAVVGARSLVKNTYPGNCVLAGVPARVIKTGVTWDRADLPLEP